jgi:4-amino-4-deoxy-L-arabinose transferase-like glycosyltransferase
MARVASSWPLAIAALVGISVPLQVIWLVRFRHSSLTEWDEAGYIQIGVLDRVGLAHDGLVGLARAVVHQPGEAPLVPLAAVPIYLVAGTGVFQSLFVLPLFFGVLLLATYGLARTLVSRGWAAVATLTVSGVPAVIDYTRLFHFAVPATAFTTLALWALFASDGLRRRWWVVAAGACVALMLLSRTMTLAYLPGFALAAALQLLRGRELRRVRALNLALGAAVAAAVTATWYVPNAGSVHSYLVGAGYGASSGSFGTKHPVVSTGFWSKELRLVVQQLYGPLALVLATCLLAGAVAAIRAGAQRRLRDRRPLIALGLAAFVLEGYLVLTSSTNEGTAFALPWLPALIVLAVAGAARTRMSLLRATLGISLVTVALLGLAMKSGAISTLASPRSFTVPLLDRVPLLDGRSVIQREVAAAGYPIGDPTEPLPPMHRRWLPLARRVTALVLAQATREHVRPTVIVAMEDRLFNNTRIRLAAALWFGRYLPVGRLTAAAGGDRASAYASELRASGSPALLTAPPEPGAQGTLTTTKVTTGASEAGFRPLRRFRLPDGRPLQLWWRSDGEQHLQ